MGILHKSSRRSLPRHRNRQKCSFGRVDELEPRQLFSTIDFINLPETITTPLEEFVVAGRTEPGFDVKLNGDSLPMNDRGVYLDSVRLSPGLNTLDLAVISNLGQEVARTAKVVFFDSQMSTADQRLIYVDVVKGDTTETFLDGTVVIDVDANTVLGLIQGMHARGLSPDGAMLFMHDGTIISTADHRVLGTLPLSREIPLNGFAATADRAFSGNEIVDLEAITSDPDPLPIALGDGFSSWSGASYPGTPALAPDSSLVCGENHPVVCVDLDTGSVIDTGISGHFLSDVAFTPDGSQLLVSEYSFAQGRLDFYDATTFQWKATVDSIKDFAGEIAFISDELAVVGSAGNAAWLNGRVSLVDINAHTVIDFMDIPLADNLATSPAGEIFVSTGAGLGVDVLLFEDGALLRSKTFVLGINESIGAAGRPKTDQIRRILYRGPVNVAPRNELPGIPGDSNLDGVFNQLDLVLVLRAGKYLAGPPASWTEGDWDGDGQFNQNDIVVAAPHYLQPRAQARRGENDQDS